MITSLEPPTPHETEARLFARGIKTASNFIVANNNSFVLAGNNFERSLNDDVRIVSENLEFISDAIHEHISGGESAPQPDRWIPHGRLLLRMAALEYGYHTGYEDAYLELATKLTPEKPMIQRVQISPLAYKLGRKGWTYPDLVTYRQIKLKTD